MSFYARANQEQFWKPFLSCKLIEPDLQFSCFFYMKLFSNTNWYIDKNILFSIWTKIKIKIYVYVLGKNFRYFTRNWVWFPFYSSLKTHWFLFFSSLKDYNKTEGLQTDL